MSRKKPTHLKAISGTNQPCRQKKETPAPGTVLAIAPDPPDWLPNAHAIKEWKRLAPILVTYRRLTDAALSTFGHLCAVHGKMVQLWAAGEMPTAHMLSQYNKLIDSFGIPPMAAGKLKPVDDGGGKQNKFANFTAEAKDAG